MKHIKIQNGFSIVEIIVAIFIISMGLIGVLSLVVQNIQAQRISKNILIASQLAQEGLELTRVQRDNNWIDGESWFCTNIVGKGASATFSIYFNGSEIVIDNDDVDAELNIEDGFYVHGGGGDYSGFNRVISASNTSEEASTISCIVQWKEKGEEHQYVADTILYDWK